MISKWNKNKGLIPSFETLAKSSKANEKNTSLPQGQQKKIYFGNFPAQSA
jgi:hypothetical protein